MNVISCELGPLCLPGVCIEPSDDTEIIPVDDITEWTTENKCGRPLKNNLWLFKREEERAMFLLRWA